MRGLTDEEYRLMLDAANDTEGEPTEAEFQIFKRLVAQGRLGVDINGPPVTPAGRAAMRIHEAMKAFR